MGINEVLGIIAENLSIDMNVDEEFALRLICYLYSEEVITSYSMFDYMMKEAALADRIEAEYEGEDVDTAYYS